MANRTKTSMSASDRVSAATFPTGINYADRTVEVKGDYKRLAFLPFDTLELEWIAKRVPPDVRDYIVADAAKIQARRGQQYQTSQAGQTVMLGSSSSAPKSPARLDREIAAALSDSLPGISDTLRRSDMRVMPSIPRRASRPRVMFAVVSDGRDLGAHKTRELAQAEADRLPDAYVTEVMRSSR